MKKFLALLLILSLFALFFPAGVLAQTTSLELDPANGTFNRGCSFSLNIQLKTGGAATEGVDAIIIYDSSRLTANSITKGTIFPDYPINNIDSATGRIAISAIASVGSPFTGSGVFAGINFTVPNSAATGTTQISFDFNPQKKDETRDSNVSGVVGGVVVDMLDSVLNGSFVIGTGVCGAQPVASAAPTQAGTSPGSGFVVMPNTGGQGAGYVSTPSAYNPPTTYVPLKSLPEGGTKELTLTLAIIGSVLTILGILGLALL
ncbi:hypothetical protein HYU45_04200 [Candidatus Daviesbacteria bacterium]|nr:hypothetical protein [Candidatus Daviesbacteria bacterium]